MLRNQKLSLCMIVKDEEDCIADCLQSVKSVVDEMIVVDTGSTDRTVEICESLGAVVHRFVWNGSFSDARNYGLKQATGDWILWLDADEAVDERDVHLLRDALYAPDPLLSIQLVNYFGERPDPNQTFLIAHTRLFRNRKGFRFRYSIHEMLNADEILAEMGITKIPTLPIRVHHYGYLDEKNEQKNKLERNLGMLRKEAEKSDHGPWIDYHLASEYYRANQYNESFAYVNRAIVGFLKESLTPPSLLYRLKYSILINTGSIEGAWPGIERAIMLYPDYVDLHFYKGVVLIAKEMYVEALETFDRCLELGEENLQHLTLKGLGSFQALHFKAYCLEQLGHYQDAADVYARALEISPTFSASKEALQELVKKHGDVVVGTDTDIDIDS
ncbi:glycosyltransferase [Paenibacillus caui]|uniref:glycosyltransferase n=1 Tax=Paenibacillus caui TaxID=2873927 RepID=UPI001F25C9E8|nr:glycosyltransferase [Paenibacillus caui]